MLNDNVKNTIYRTMTNDSRESAALAAQVFKGQGEDEIMTQGKYWDKHSIKEEQNPQNTEKYTEAQLRKLAEDNPVEPAVFPTTVGGRGED